QEFAQWETFFTQTEAYLGKIQQKNADMHNLHGRMIFMEDTPLQFPDGNMYTVARGTVKFEDNTLIFRDGTIRMENGTVRNPDGSIEAGGVIKYPNGAIRLADGTTKYTNGAIQ
ncbi:MAG TPA: hypothetical protein VI588_01605, partial [Candidatus Gracilibacteria bacterium]|nr:hypothetical protein [Candidatus Gracilibacteria bacterium]